MIDEHDPRVPGAKAASAERRRAAVFAAVGIGTAFWDGVVAVMRDGFSLLDADGVHVEVNPALCALTGFTRDELIGAGPPHPYWPPEERAAIDDAFARTVAGRGETFALTFMRKDGSRFPVLVTPSVVRGADGQVKGAFATVKDVTELRTAQEALAVSEERHRLLLQNMNDAVYVHEIDEAGPGAVSDVNERACEMLGYTREELLGLEVGALDVPEQRERLPRIMTSLREEGRAVFETEHVAKDGRRVPVEVSARVLQIGGRRTVLSVAREISERRRILEALRESEAKYRAVVDGATDGIVIGRDGRLVFANAAFARMSGYSVEEVNGIPFLDLVRDEQREEIADRVRRRLAGEDVPGTYDIDLVGKSGATFSVEVRADVIDYLGAPADLVIMRDVTESHRVQHALRESEARYRTVVDGTTDGIVIGRDGRLLFANAAFERMSGYSAGELAGFELVKMVQPERQDEIARQAKRRAAGLESPDAYELELIRRDGTTYLVEVRAAVIDLDGAPALLAAMRDVTERRRLERLLEDERLKFKMLVENSGEAFLQTRPEGPVDFANPAACAMFGYTADEIVGCDRADLADTADPRLAESLALRAHVGHFAGPLRMRRSDGTVFEADVSSTVYRDHLGTRRTSMIVRDLTEQRRAEEEIRRLNAELQQRVMSRTEQLDAATRELEAIAYSMAHDVRAPLRTIDGFSAILVEDEAANLSAEGLDNLRRVRGAAQTLARLIDDLTGLSSVSRHDLERELLDVSGIAARVAGELHAEHPSRDVDVAVEPGLEAHADPHLVRLIFRELLDNAWKFTAPRRHAHVWIGAVTDGDGRAFFVRDDGVGFDMAYATHLFGAFQRMHPPGEFDGDGVGLAMVQRLVRRHGGRVWAAATVGEGATISFTLPAADGR